jgi:hypothetical protein
MFINLKITLRTDGKVKETVTCPQGKHMIEKSDPGLYISVSTTVDGKRQYNTRFAGGALDGCPPNPIHCAADFAHC